MVYSHPELVSFLTAIVSVNKGLKGGFGVGFVVGAGWGVERGAVVVVGSADGIKFVLDYGYDMGSSYGSFYYSNDRKPVGSFLDDHLNTMMELYFIYLIL